MKKAILKEDYYSYNYKLYDKKGAELTIKFKHGNTYIVQNERGNIYALNKERLDESKIPSTTNT
jgi:hypothetical protein